MTWCATGMQRPRRVSFLLQRCAWTCRCWCAPQSHSAGLSATVGEQFEALRRFAAKRPCGLIAASPIRDRKIVSGWPQNFDAMRATALGFEAEKTFDEIIRIHIEMSSAEVG